VENNKLAVLIIDMQPSFISRLREGEKERTIPNQIKVIRMCGTEKVPIFVTELEYWNNGRTIPEIMDEVSKNSASPVEPISRQFSDAFDLTGLDSLLRNNGIGKLFLMGAYAEYCVLRTAEEAIGLGYQVITSNDVIAGKRNHMTNNSVDWYEQNGICVRVSELENLEIFPKTETVPV